MNGQLEVLREHYNPDCPREEPDAEDLKVSVAYQQVA
jgi:hypothetical protein